MTPSPIRKRVQLADEISQEAISQTGILVSFSGFEGAGKTTLLRRIASAMLATTPVHFVTADEYEKNEPYSFLERLLSTGLAPLDLVDHTLAPIPMAREALKWLTREARPQLQTIIVDDVHWIDPDSMLALRYLVPRVVRQGYFIALAGDCTRMRPDVATFIDELVKSTPHSRRHDLAPLGVADIRALSLDRLGVCISPYTAQTLLNATGGSFLGIDAVFTRITREERNSLYLLWDIPLRGISPETNPLLAELEDLPPAARTSVEIVACADGELRAGDIAQVAQALGEVSDPAPAVARAILCESGFGSTVVARHALVAHAVRQALAPARSRAIFRALASVASGMRKILYALNGAETWDQELARAIDEYTDQALAEGNASNAQEVLRRGLDLARGSARHGLLHRLGLVSIRDKTVFRILDLLPQFDELPAGPVKECLILTMVAHRRDLEFPHQRLDALLAVQTEDPDLLTLLTFTAFLSVGLVMRGRIEAALDATIDRAQCVISRAPADPALVDARLRWMVAPEATALVLECYRLLRGRQGLSVDEAARRLYDLAARVRSLPAGAHTVDSLVPLAGTALDIGDIEFGRDLAAESVALLDSVEKPWAVITGRLIHAHCESLLGSLSAAVDLAEVADAYSPEAVDIEARPGLLALKTWLIAARGDIEYPDLGALAEQVENRPWEAYGEDLFVLAECEVARSRADPAAIVEATHPERVSRFGFTQHGFLTYRAHALIDLDRIDEAEALIAQLTTMHGSTWQEYWGGLSWLKARAAQGRRPDHEVEALFAAATLDERFPLPHALTLRDYGRFLIAQNRMDSARESLRAAQRVIEGIGAFAYAASIREALDVVDQKRQSVLHTLTERESEISRLVAQGLSNQEIAAELFVSPTTVRYHVSNLLRKLQVSKRAEVARLIHASRRS